MSRVNKVVWGGDEERDGGAGVRWSRRQVARGCLVGAKGGCGGLAGFCGVWMGQASVWCVGGRGSM